MRGVLRALLGIGFCLAAGVANSQPLRIDRVDIVEAGLLEARKVSQRATPGTASGETSVLDSIVFYEGSRKVPGKVDIQFGARYRVVGQPVGQKLPIVVKWLVPQPGMRNPLTGEITHEDSAEEVVEIGAEKLAGYKFGHAWEIVPGNWTLELAWNGHTLSRVNFTVGKE